MVVSDHAEYLGLTPGLRRSDLLLLETGFGRRWHDMLKSGVYDQIFQAAMEAIRSIADADEKIKNKDFTRSTWEEMAQTADCYN